MTRTYGTYQYVPPQWAGKRARGQWALTMEPQVIQRAKRLFGRVRTDTRGGRLLIADTVEVCRDLQWFMERYPLTPNDERSENWLTEGADEHRQKENTLTEILAGTYQAPAAGLTPAKTPREYQTTAKELLRARGSLLLGDAVGLGKTITALLNLSHTDALPALVVAPTHLPRQWARELAELFPTLTYEIGKTTKPSLKAQTGLLADVTIISYSKLVGWGPTMANQVNTIIFDEVQELRHGTSTDKGKAAAGLADTAIYKIGLSATPVYGYGGELWNIYDILAPNELGTRDEFTREWGGAQLSNNRLMVKNPDALGAYLREQGLLLARSREDVGRQLPKTIKVTHQVDRDPHALEAVAGNTHALAELLLSGGGTALERMQAASDIDWQVRQATGVGKAPYVAEFVRMLLESEEKILLFGWHRDVYDEWMDRLAEFHPALYTGSESPKQKADAEERFTKPRNVDDPNDCRILIMSLRSGAGVDGLQKVAQVVVFGELDWSPATHEQAIGRVRRDGMTDNPPVAYFLVTDDGSDPALMEALQLKRQQAEPIMTKDGQLMNTGPTENNRAKMLAAQILGLPLPTDPTTEEQEPTA